MFDREVDIGGRKAIIRLEGRAFSNYNGCCFFGFPLSSSLNEINIGNIKDYLNSIKGEFLFVGLESDRLIIANDVAGGYRLYWCKFGTVTYYSDNYEYLLEVIREYEPPILDRHEHHYWAKHRYTTGGETFIKGLHKLEPATVLEFTSAGRESHCYFKDLENTPDARAHSRFCLQDLEDTIRQVGSSAGHVILFYSGGVDSTLLAVLMKELHIDFTLLYMRSHPFFDSNYEDYVRSKATADYLGLTLKEIEVDLNDGMRKLDHIVPQILFDRHFALLHFLAFERVEKEYGRDVIIVNGQGADSVLSFGPSQRTKGDFAARILMYRPFGFWSRLAGVMVRRVYGGQYHNPKTDSEFLGAFFDQYHYYTVASEDDTNGYREYLDGIVERIKRRFKSWNALLMYLKVHGFMQGSDNQVVLKSAHAVGLDRVIMPYTSSGFIYNTVKYKSSTRELFHPKYVISDSLKALGCRPPTGTMKDHSMKVESLDELTGRIDEYFYDMAGQLLAEDVQLTAQ